MKHFTKTTFSQPKHKNNPNHRFYEIEDKIKGIDRRYVLGNTFEKSKKQNPRKRGWDLKKKIEILWVGVAECKKTMFLKTKFSIPFKKLSFFAFYESMNHELVVSLLVKCADAQGRFSWVRSKSRTTLCLKFLRNWNFLRISRLEATHEGKREMAKHKDFQHQKIDILRKTFRTKVTKTQKSFWIWSSSNWTYTNHIWTCTITQMK